MKLLKIELFPSIYQRLEITSDISIGRDPENQIILKDMSISGQHAVIGHDGDRYWIEDQGSTNGTFVNDCMIHKKYLEEQDIITIGYSKIIFCSEEEPTLRYELAQLPYDYKDKDDFAITLPSKGETIAQLMTILQERIIFLDLDKFGKAVAIGIENAHNYGNDKDSKKQIYCRYQKTATQLRITILDQGQGFNYESYFNNILTKGQEAIRGIASLMQESDALEFNPKGNHLVLIKNLTPNTNKTKESSARSTEHIPIINKRKTSGIARYMSLRYFRFAVHQQPFPIKIVVTSQPLHIFPEHLNIKPTTTTTGGSLIMQVRPVFPGCLVHPPLQDVDVLQTPTKIEFWVTPISSLSFYPMACIHWIQEGKVIQITKTPLNTRNAQVPKRVLWATFVVPLLLMILDIPSYQINRELPTLAQYLLYIISMCGGLSIFGLILGLCCFCVGLFLHWRIRPVMSEVVNAEMTLF